MTAHVEIPQHLFTAIDHVGIAVPDLDEATSSRSERGLSCADYTPQAVKMAVCGSGGAGKTQVQQMVGVLLGLPSPPASDHAADALAVAICHAGHMARQAAAERAGALA